MKNQTAMIGLLFLFSALIMSCVGCSDGCRAEKAVRDKGTAPQDPAREKAADMQEKRALVPAKLKEMAKREMQPFKSEILEKYLPAATGGWKANKVEGYSAKNRDDPKNSFVSRSYNSPEGSVTVKITDVLSDYRRIGHTRQISDRLRNKEGIISGIIQEEERQGVTYYDPPEQRSYTVFMVGNRIAFEITGLRVSGLETAEKLIETVDIAGLNTRIGMENAAEPPGR